MNKMKVRNCYDTGRVLSSFQWNRMRLFTKRRHREGIVTYLAVNLARGVGIEPRVVRYASYGRKDKRDMNC